jgi:hypothetical protein
MTTIPSDDDASGSSEMNKKKMEEAMKDVVERAMKKLSGRAPTFAMLFATPEAMRTFAAGTTTTTTTTTTATTTTTTGKGDDDEKKKRKKKTAEDVPSAPKLCRDLLRKKTNADVKLIGGVVESVISGHAQTQNGLSLTLARFPSAGTTCETFRAKGDDLPSVRWKEVMESDARGDSTVCLTFCAPSFTVGGVVVEHDDAFEDDDDDDDDDDEKERKKSKRAAASLRPALRPTLDTFLMRLKHAVPNNLVCFGGALENDSGKHSALFHDDEVYSSSSYSGCVGVMLYGDGGFDVKSSSFSEGKPIGRAMKITKASLCGTEILELDKEPARNRIKSILSSTNPDDLNKRVSVGIGGFLESRMGEDDSSYAFARGEVVSLGRLVMPGAQPKTLFPELEPFFASISGTESIEISGATAQEGAVAQIHVDENESSSRERMQKKFGKIAALKPAGTLFFSDVRSNRMLAADFAEMIGSKAAVAGAYLRKEICGIGSEEKERFAVTKSTSTVLAFYNKGKKNGRK